MNRDQTLASGFGGNNIELPGYEVFFNGLLDITRGKKVDETLAGKIQGYVSGFVQDNPFCAEHADPSGYQRSCLGRDPKSGWEVILMVWSKGNRTKIHGHPQFAGYTFAGGDFQLEVFSQHETEGLTLAQSVEINSLSGFHSIGEADAFDNHIHRITCLSDRGYSLHVYSDNALKGYKYEDPAKA